MQARVMGIRTSCLGTFKAPHKVSSTNRYQRCPAVRTVDSLCHKASASTLEERSRMMQAPSFLYTLGPLESPVPALMADIDRLFSCVKTAECVQGHNVPYSASRADAAVVIGGVWDDAKSLDIIQQLRDKVPIMFIALW